MNDATPTIPISPEMNDGKAFSRKYPWISSCVDVSSGPGSSSDFGIDGIVVGFTEDSSDSAGSCSSFSNVSHPPVASSRPCVTSFSPYVSSSYASSNDSANSSSVGSACAININEGVVMIIVDNINAVNIFFICLFCEECRIDCVKDKR